MGKGLGAGEETNWKTTHLPPLGDVVRALGVSCRRSKGHSRRLPVR